MITKFEARFKEAQAEAQQLAAEVAQDRRRAEAAEARVSEVLEQRAKARRAQERQAAEFAGLQASLRAEVSAAKVRGLLPANAFTSEVSVTTETGECLSATPSQGATWVWVV